MATAGITVLAPSPVKPPSRPLTSKVGRPQTRSSVDVSALPEQFRRAELLAIAGLVERQLLELRPLLVAQRPHVVVEAGDLDAAALVLHLREDLREHHGGIGDRAAERAGMQIALRAAQIDLEVDEAAQAVADRGDAAVEHRRVRDHHDVGGEFVLVGLDEVVEIGGPDFFLALEDDADVHRQAAVLLQMRLDGLEVHEDLALVVGGAARVDLAVADRRLEGRRLPQVDRIDGLDVVVAVEEDRRRPLRCHPVAIDDRVARRLDQPDVLHADAAQFIRRPFGAAGARRPGAAAGR